MGWFIEAQRTIFHRVYCYIRSDKYCSLLQCHPCLTYYANAGNIQIGGGKKAKTTKTSRSSSGRSMFGNTRRATQSVRCTGELKPGSPVLAADRHEGPAWKLLYFHLAVKTCTQTRPEQTLWRTTEWKRHRNDPSRLVSTAAIAANCFPLTTLTVILRYSSD